MTDLEYSVPRKQEKALSWRFVPVALGLASLIGLVMLLILEASDYATGGVWDDVFWVMFSLGGILALLTGVIVYVVGRKRRDHQAMRMGIVGPAWFVIALLIVVIVEAVS